MTEQEMETPKRDSIDGSLDNSIMSSISTLTQQLLAIDTGSDTDAFTRDPKALYDEYNNFKVHTKKLLEQLFLKLEENNAYTKSLENDIGGLHKDIIAKDSKLVKLTKYVESFIEKCSRDADEKCAAVSEELEEVKRDKLAVERTVLKLTAENRKLKDEVKLLRIAETGTANSTTMKAHMADMIYENEDLRDQILRQAEELANLKRQREAEMLSVMNVIREFESIIRGVPKQMK